MTDRLLALIFSLESTLDFVYVQGGVTPVASGNSTNWRSMPWLLTTYVQGGAAYVETEGGSACRYGDGDVCCIAPGIRHRIDCAQSYVSWWSHMSFKLAGGLALTEFIDIPVIVSGECAVRIKFINGELASISSREVQTLDSLLRTKALGFDLAATLASRATVRQDRLGLLNGAERLRPVLMYIDAHLDEDLSRERLASLLSLSPPRFYALFHNAFGIGSNLYVRRRRIYKAQQLLITTDLSVGEIGTVCGYTDQFFFSRVFKKLQGLSPLQYRSQAKSRFG